MQQEKKQIYCKTNKKKLGRPNGRLDGLTDKIGRSLLNRNSEATQANKYKYIQLQLKCYSNVLEANEQNLM